MSYALVLRPLAQGISSAHEVADVCQLIMEEMRRLRAELRRTGKSLVFLISRQGTLSAVEGDYHPDAIVRWARIRALVRAARPLYVIHIGEVRRDSPSGPRGLLLTADGPDVCLFLWAEIRADGSVAAAEETHPDQVGGLAGNLSGRWTGVH